MTRDAVEIAKKLRRCATETWPFAGRVSNTGSPASDNNFGRAVAFMHEAADELDRLAALHASPVGAEPPSLLDAIDALKSPGGCWCDTGDGTTHTTACAAT